MRWIIIVVCLLRTILGTTRRRTSSSLVAISHAWPAMRGWCRLIARYRCVRIGPKTTQLWPRRSGVSPVRASWLERHTHQQLNSGPEPGRCRCSPQFLSSGSTMPQRLSTSSIALPRQRLVPSQNRTRLPRAPSHCWQCRSSVQAAAVVPTFSAISSESSSKLPSKPQSATSSIL